MDLDLWMGFLEVSDDRREKVVPQCRTCPDADAPFHKAGQFADNLFRICIEAQDLLRILIQYLSGRGQGHGTAGPVKELCLIDLFEGLDLQAYRRLREMDNLRGF
jgi:hypothetical protein